MTASTAACLAAASLIGLAIIVAMIQHVRVTAPHKRRRVL